MDKEEQDITVKNNQIAMVGEYDKIKIDKGVIQFTCSVDLAKNSHLLEKLSNEQGNPVLIGLSFQQQELDV